MIKCPNCGNTIPSTNQICQFCKAPIPPNLRAAAPKPNYKHDDDSLEAGSGLPPEKVWKIYTFLAWFWIVSAIWEIFWDILIYPGASGREIEFGAVAVIALIFGGIQILFGIGLLARWEGIRKFVTVLCIIRILFGLLGLLGSMATILVIPVLGVIAVIMTVFDLVVNAAVIWAINETERLMNWDRMNYRR